MDTELIRIEGPMKYRNGQTKHYRSSTDKVMFAGHQVGLRTDRPGAKITFFAWSDVACHEQVAQDVSAIVGEPTESTVFPSLPSSESDEDDEQDEWIDN